MNVPPDPNVTSDLPSADPGLALGLAEPADSVATIDLARGSASTDGSRPGTDAPAGDLPPVPGYRVVREIARGGMGRVLAAHDLGLDRDVALKVLLPGANADRFVRESKITARLPHPGIPPVHALGTLTDGSPFLAMKLIAGQTLAEELKAADRPRLLQAFTQVCHAVGFAHSRGVVHRDLKPANVMVGAFGEVQVMDWGLAKECGVEEVDSSTPHSTLHTPHSEMTQAGAVLGTPAYMAPEQARGAATDARADVFALGGILCAILTGQPPFRGMSSHDVIRRAAAADLAEANARLDECGADAELVALCRRCLSPSPADRPAAGLAVADALTTYLNGVQERLRAAEVARAAESARAEEATLTAAEANERAKAERRARRVQAIAAGLVLLALTAGIVSTAVGLVRADDARAREAERAEGERAAKMEAEGNLAEAERQRTLADRSFREARKAVDDFLTRVGQERLLNEPGMHPLRNGLLNLALTYHQGFLNQRGDDPTVRAELALSYARVGKITGDVGTLADALAAYHKAVAIQEQVVREQPDSVEYQLKLAEIHRGLVEPLRLAGRADEALDHGKKAVAINEKLAGERPGSATQSSLADSCGAMGVALLVAGELGPAAEFLQKGIALLERLAAQSPEDPEWLVELGGKLHNLSIVYARSKRFEDAEQAIRRAVGHQKSAYERAPGVVRCAQFLANHYSMLGEMQRALARPEEAIRSAQAGIEIIRRLSRENPAVIDYKDGLAGKLHSLGMAQTDLKQYPAALASLQESCTIRERLAADDPDQMDYRNRLGGSWHEIGLAMDESGQLEQAVGAYQKAIAHQRVAFEKSPRVAVYRSYLGNHYSALAGVQLRLGRPAEAATAAQAFRPLVAGNPARLYQSASLHARCAAAYDKLTDPPANAAALRQACLDQAVESLREATAAGFKDVNKARTDPDLAVLRDQAGFKELVGK